MSIRGTVFLSLIVSQSIFASTTSEATNYLNKLRQDAGVIKVIADEDLGKAAKNHSDYMKEENIFSHQETNQNNSHYTGEWTGDRLSHINYPYTAYNENISGGNSDITTSIDALFQAIYHRLNFLSLEVNRIGAGVSGQYFTYNMATKSPQYYNDIQDKNPKVVLWPPKDYDKAQPAFFNTEFPAPLPECNTGGSSSNPISIQFNPAKSQTITLKSFELRDSKNTLVPTKQITDRLDNGQFAFISKDRFKWGERYSAVFSYSEDGKDKTISWNFKTKTLKHPLITLTSTDKTYSLAKNDTMALYFKPDSCMQTSSQISFDPSKITIAKTIDKDTYYMKITGSVGSDFEVNHAGKTYKFHIFTSEINNLSFSDITSNSLTINWTHTNSGDETGYKIYRDGVLIHTASIDDRSYTDTNLSPNHTYRYTVKVTND